MDYKKAGVDIEAGYKSVELMKEHVKKTMRPEVLGGLGGFSGAFSLSKIKEMEDPVLLSGTDGCGTKVKLAMIMDKHDTIGIDAVAMCVNDIACAGGEPLFFLDYIACGKNYPEKIAAIVKGVAEGCLQSEAALIGGETAEHPGMMAEDEYDLAGFAVGVCDRKDMITGENLNAGVSFHRSSSSIKSSTRPSWRSQKRTEASYLVRIASTSSGPSVTSAYGGQSGWVAQSGSAEIFSSSESEVSRGESVKVPKIAFPKVFPSS